MKEEIPKYTDREGAARLVTLQGDEFAVVENPAYVFPRYDIYPLARKTTALTSGIVGAVMDMDGTTTTTEPLCLHALETMVRRITGRENDPAWPGLDHGRDYPHIIGNSTTKHVEYLIRTYQEEIVEDALKCFYVYSAVWTLGKAADEGRKREVANNLVALGIAGIMDEPRFNDLKRARSLDEPEARDAIRALAAQYGAGLDLQSFPNVVRAAVDIYYQRYHYILARIDAGSAGTIAASVLGGADKHLISPMNGIGVFLALVKGWLGEDVAACYDELADSLVSLGESKQELEQHRGYLAPLGRFFERSPIATAIVTSSIRYEADIVLTAVFRILSKQVEAWDIPGEKRRRIKEKFARCRDCYDGFITASDSSEIRLKPHRDLYSLALHQMGIPPDDFKKVIGFEDSESGTIAIRAAGIPLCVALPFPETTGHTRTRACTRNWPLHR